jgi:tetratricopeptide (TPR) repeat protein
LRAIGDLDQAEIASQKAVNLNPSSAEVHMDLADVLYMKDQYNEAEVELQKAMDLQPDTPRVYIKLSHVQERANKIIEALETVDKAVELNPEMPEAYIRKGSIYMLANRIDEAEKSYLKGLELNPNSPAALVAIAELYQSKGEMSTSKKYVNKAKKLNSDLPGIYLTLSKLKKFKKNDPDLEHMRKIEKTVESKGLDAASVLNFSLFKAYEDTGDYKKAFYHLKKGNDYKRKTIPYDHEQQKEIYENVKKTYSKEFIKGFDKSGYNSKVPIFILGMPRSGTTLTEQIISSHPDVFPAGELHEIGMLPLEFGPINKENCREMGQWYVKQVKKMDSSKSAKHITDKMPGNYMSLGKIACILPKAKIIHTRRDPIDTCLSCFKQNFARGHYYSYDLEDLAEHYLLYLDLMEHWRKVCPDKFIEIDYEDTVSDLETQARKLIDYIGLPWNDACLKPHKQKRAVLTASKTQVIKPIYKTSVKSWERYEKNLKPLIKGLKLEKDKTGNKTKKIKKNKNKK